MAQIEISLDLLFRDAIQELRNFGLDSIASYVDENSLAAAKMTDGSVLIDTATTQAEIVHKNQYFRHFNMGIWRLFNKPALLRYTNAAIPMDGLFGMEKDDYIIMFDRQYIKVDKKENFMRC